MPDQILSQEEIDAMAKANMAASATGDDNSYGSGSGGAASRSTASTSPDFSAYGNGNNTPTGAFSLTGASSGAPGAAGNLSAGVQSALDRSGITSRSIFQMVHDQYKKKTPMMLGSQERKAASHADNPFADLSKDQIEL